MINGSVLRLGFRSKSVQVAVMFLICVFLSKLFVVAFVTVEFTIRFFNKHICRPNTYSPPTVGFLLFLLFQNKTYSRGLDSTIYISEIHQNTGIVCLKHVVTCLFQVKF